MINVSVVLYKHTPDEISGLVYSLKQSERIAEIYLVDNSPERSEAFGQLPITYIFNGKNLGYGAGHNIAIRKSLEAKVEYHLVVNPDIELEARIFDAIENFMNKNSETGLLMPKIYYPSGEIQYLCKLLPTPFDLIFRRFIPSSWSRKRMEHFELRQTGYNRIMDVPYLSGCFMFLRMKAIRQVGMFDERFFMYPEDIDLSRRIHRQFRTVFYPEVSVVHHHAQASYHTVKMLIAHSFGAIKYFNKWGWFCDKERKLTNKLY